MSILRALAAHWRNSATTPPATSSPRFRHSARLGEAVDGFSACPVCEEYPARLVATRGRGSVPLRTLQCVKCGLFRTDPAPTTAQIANFHRSEYRQAYKGLGQPSARHILRAAKLAVERYEHFQHKLSSGTSVLDVGCSSGEWVYLLQWRGCTAIGIDPDLSYADFGRAAYGIVIESGSIEDFTIPPECFDVVTAFHSLEHTVDPVAALMACARVLKPRGTLLLEVPNVACRAQHPLGRFHPAHPVGFERESLINALLMAGFIPLRLYFDEAKRNIRASARKCHIWEEGESDLRVRKFVRAYPAAPANWRALLDYYSTPATYGRTLKRALRSIKERLTTRSTRSPIDIVETVFESRGLGRLQDVS